MIGYLLHRKNRGSYGYKPFKIGEIYETSIPKDNLNIYSPECIKFTNNIGEAVRIFTLKSYSDSVILEVEVLGDIVYFDTTGITNKVKVIREIDYYTSLYLSNNGEGNTGIFNIGNHNTGNFNFGKNNTGDYNEGDSNTGNNNSGIRNSGDFNIGHYNTGDFNIGNYLTGSFNTIPQPVYLFNKPTNLTLEQISSLPGVILLKNTLKAVRYYEEDMANCSRLSSSFRYEVTKLPVKTHYYSPKQLHKMAWLRAWTNLSESDKQKIYDIPNFDKEVFYEITGILV